MKNNSDKVLKRLIIIIILCVIIIAGIMITMVIVNYNQKKNMGNSSTILELKNMEQKIGNNNYYLINNLISDYYTKINLLNNAPDYDIDSIYNILNKEYVSKNNINKDNIIEYYNDYAYNDFIIEKLYFTQNNNVTTTYLVLGKEISENSAVNRDYGFIILLDEKNNTFSIAPYELIQQLNITSDTNISDIIDISNIESDEKNINSFYNSLIDEKDVIKLIYNNYLKIAKSDSSYAYELLDKDYKDVRFSSKEEAESYLSNILQNVHSNNIVNIYSDNSDINYTLYVCKDDLGNILLIKKDDNFMDYSILLDSYTIHINFFDKMYEKYDTAKRTAYCVELFKQMINLKDFKSAYNVLDKDFRENNFGSPEGLEKYINDNWYEFIDISYIDYKVVNDYGTINVNIKDKNSNTTINKTFIVDLKDNLNFVMSFNK